MKRLICVAVLAAASLTACAAPEVPSRMATDGRFFDRFETPDAYMPQVIGARAENDFMRFSTMSVTR